MEGIMALLRRYRLALDVGSTSIGWAVLRLASDINIPTAIMKTGVRIFQMVETQKMARR